jgi:hypothetical protein
MAIRMGSQNRCSHDESKCRVAAVTNANDARKFCILVYTIQPNKFVPCNDKALQGVAMNHHSFVNSCGLQDTSRKFT